MKLAYKGVVYDALTLEYKDGTVVDIDHVSELPQPLENLNALWGYICKECAEKNNIDISELGLEDDKMVCYADGCKNRKAYSFLVENQEDLERISILKTGKAIYDSHGGDTTMNHYTGQEVEIIRPLTNREADLWDIGMMYCCRFKDGCVKDVFEDELQEIE